jgi:allophanate hydrolase subunit 2
MQIEPPTHRSPRLIRAKGGALTALAALAGAALLSACGSSSSKTSTEAGSASGAHLNTARVALSIEQSILKERHIHAKVSCPAVVPQETGKTFTCIATNTTTVTPKGGKPTRTTVTTPFTVTIQNNRGYVTYHS